MKNTSKYLLSVIATAGLLAVGCGDEVPGSKCDPACTDGQVCNEDTGKCEDKVVSPTECDPACTDNQICNENTGKCEDKPTTSKCDPACTDGKVCNEETGECEGGDPGVVCTDGKSECAGACFDLKTDNDNCGECGNVCNSGEICKDSKCEAEIIEAVCKDDEPAVCEGNTLRKCVEGQYERTDCGEQECNAEEAACKDKIITDCDANYIPVCVGNSAKTCGDDGMFVTTDCGNKACKDGACTEEEFKPECENDMAPKCDENNNIVTCESQKLVLSSCGTLACENAECVTPKECDHTGENTPVCTMDGELHVVKTCGDDDKFVLTPCGESQTCIDGECKNTTIEDLCPDDDTKTAPGVCGCGLPDVDLDKNGTIDCLEGGDLCPDDPNKELPGICGCGIPDTLNATSNNPICLEYDKDLCPDDANKTMPGVCGCGLPDTFDELTRQPLCIGMKANGRDIDACKNNNEKLLPGTCGCDMLDTIDENTGVPSCVLDPESDICTTDEAKTRPGICGCGVDDQAEANITDTDGDGVPDCMDQCPNNPYKYMDDKCDCGEVRVRLDGDKDGFCAIPIQTAEEFVTYLTDASGKSNNYALMEDINLYDYYTSTNIPDWTGITGFDGKLVSRGKTVSFKNGEKRGVLNCKAANCGWFSTMSNARVHNINFDFDMKSTSTGNVGILAGHVANTNITSVNVKGNVEATGANYAGGFIASVNTSTFSNITQEGNVTATGRAGGISGHIQTATLTSITSQGNVTTTGNYAGGLFGTASYGSTVSNVSNVGDTKGKQYVGGIAGSAYTNTNTYSDLSNNGNVEGSSTHVGGIIGRILGPISNATNEGTVKGHYYVGGIVGYQDSNTITNAINKANVSNNNTDCTWGAYVGGIAGFTGAAEHTHLYNYGSITTTHPAKCANSNDNVGTAGIIGHITGTKAKLVDVHNYGDINAASTHSVGGIVGFTYALSIKDASNSGNITCAPETGKGYNGGCTYYGGIFGSWGSHSASSGVYTLENLKNTGNITALAAVGGIAGEAKQLHESTTFSLNNLVNTGNITSNLTGNVSYKGIGGLVGLFTCHNNCSFTDSYSTGDVSGNNHVGGLVGFYTMEGTDWNGALIYSTKARTIDITLDKLYATGKVAATGAYAGGLFGRLDLDFANRKVAKAAATLTCGDKTQAQPAVYQYMDVNHNIKLTNSYATGNVSGTSNVGGLIGLVQGNTNDTTFTRTTYSFDASCNLQTNTATDANVKRRNNLILANVFASGQVEGNSTTHGGLVGYYNYANSLGAAYKHTFNNVYATGLVPANGGNFIGNAPANVNFKNSYYWSDSGSNKGASSTGAITGLIEFTYEKGMPHIGGDYDVDLVNQLNANIKSSTGSTPELGPAVSTSWVSKDHYLSEKLDVTIPFLDLPEIQFEWEKSPEELEPPRD